MKSSQRQTAAAVGFFALSFAGAPLLAQRQPAPEQRGGPPRAETPYILIATFQSSDRKLGVEASDEVRHRVQGENSAKDLYVVPKNNINSTLEASGYRPDSALNASDLMELSRQLHGEYVLDGTATREGDRVKIESRILMRTGTQTVSQPLPAADGKDPGDAAKAVEKALGEALKGMPAYHKCIDALRAQKNDEAVTEARAGITAYPNSTLSRICLLNAYANKKESPDSIISVATQIVGLDKTSILAWSNLVDAYNTKGDKDKAIEANTALYRLDPSNQQALTSLIQQLGASGAPEKALTLLDSLMAQNPADPTMLRTKWVLQLNAKQFKNAIATGEQLAKVDSAAANVDFYNRQIGAAQSDSNTAKVIELAAKANQKFPKDASFPMILAQSYRKAGQLQQAMEAAHRATEADPKDSRAWLLAILTANDLKQPDTAFALARSAIAAGADKAQLGAALLPGVSAAVRNAQASRARADWISALHAAQAVDSLAQSPETQFFIGVSSYSVAADILPEVQTLAKSTKAADKAQACSLATEAEGYLTLTSINMGAGGKVDANTAGQILGAVPQYSEYVASVKKALCK